MFKRQHSDSEYVRTVIERRDCVLTGTQTSRKNENVPKNKMYCINVFATYLNLILKGYLNVMIADPHTQSLTGSKMTKRLGITGLT